MKLRLSLLALSFALFASLPAFAQAPAGATGQCKDGTYATSSSKSAGCRGHKGVQTWYAATSVKPAKSSKAETKAESKAESKPTSAPALSHTSVAPSSAGATGQCKDGSYWTGASKSGACRGHKGIQTWYGDSAAKPATNSKAESRPESRPMAAPAVPAAASRPASEPAHNMPHPAATAAPGGGAGMVWVNTSTRVYHCPSDRYYGKTKDGKYMTESQAKAMGAKGARGKGCS